MGRIVIVVPLQEGSSTAVKDLMCEAPLEVPDGGLERYEIFLSDREAVMVLEGPGLDGLPWADMSLWTNGPAWQRCAAGPPRVAELMHCWERTQEMAGVSYRPLAGPGDSEGGDVILP